MRRTSFTDVKEETCEYESGFVLSSARSKSRRDALMWDKILRIGIDAFRESQPEQFNKCVRRGIPVEHRWTAWKALLFAEAEGQAVQEQLGAECARDLLSSTSAWDTEIQQDVKGTMPDVWSFTEDREHSLARVLNAYANLNPEIGYRRGMNFIVSVLLLVSAYSEEETLWAFVCLMEHHGLNGFFQDGNQRLLHYIEATSQIVDERIPALSTHLRHLKIRPSDYMSSWFQSSFANTLPLPTTLIVWDSIMCNGLQTLIQTTVALLSSMQHVLLGLTYEGIQVCFNSMRMCSAHGEATWIGRHLMTERKAVQNCREIGVAALADGLSPRRSIHVLRQARHKRLRRFGRH